MHEIDERNTGMHVQLTRRPSSQPRLYAEEAARADAVLIRPAVSDDGAALQRLAFLDSARLPAGDTIVAEQAGSLVAAMSLHDGATIADPFRPTADIVTLLKVRAGQR